eukprot:1124743-Pelagomonas_calceolata.AAC.3
MSQGLHELDHTALQTEDSSPRATTSQRYCCAKLPNNFISKLQQRQGHIEYHHRSDSMRHCVVIPSRPM